jgi:hypothetical protein
VVHGQDAALELLDGIGYRDRAARAPGYVRRFLLLSQKQVPPSLQSIALQSFAILWAGVWIVKRAAC